MSNLSISYDSAIQDRCVHKLPTSCRLTATQNCCACEDSRPHCPAYPVYIDGAGVVNRGTRWERYCWNCKEFWNTRLAASNPPIPACQSRIPTFPDQSQFLKTWYDIFRGYRVEEGEGGLEERVPLQASSLQDVSPGRLPPPFDDCLPQPTAEVSSPTRASTAALDLISSSNSEPFSGLPQALNSHRERTQILEYQSRSLGLLRSDLLRIREHLCQVFADLESEVMDDSPAHPHSLGSLTSSPLSVDVGTVRNVQAVQGQQSMDHGRARTQLELGQQQAQQQGLHSRYPQHTPEANQPHAYQPPQLQHAVQTRQAMQQALAQQAAHLQANNTSALMPADETGRRLEAIRRQRLQGSENDQHPNILSQYHDMSRQINDTNRRLSQLGSDVRAVAQDIGNGFGTPEEVERPGETYQNPQGDVFGNAWTAYHGQEQRRAHHQNNGAPINPPLYLSMSQNPQGDGWGPFRDATSSAASNPQPSFYSSSTDAAPTSVQFPQAPSTPSSIPPYFGFASHPPVYPMPPVGGHRGPIFPGAPPTMHPNAPQGHYPGPYPGTESDVERRLYNRVHRTYAAARDLTNLSSPSRHSELRAPRLGPRFGHGYSRFDRRIRQQGLDDPDADLPDFAVGDYYYDEIIRDHPRLDDTCASFKGLDNGNDGRPEPKTEEQLKVSLECKVCYSQLVDTVLLPCGHAILCQWCANQHAPSSRHDKTRPHKPSKCPMCRKGIRNKVKIHLG